MEFTSRGILAVLSKVKARVRVAETYFFTKGQLDIGVYTDAEGRCRRAKFKEPKSTAEVLTNLLQNRLYSATSNRKVCFYYIRRTRNCLTSDEGQALLTKHRNLPFACIQPYIESRADNDPVLSISVSLQDNTYVSTYSQIPGAKQGLIDTTSYIDESGPTEALRGTAFHSTSSLVPPISQRTVGSSHQVAAHQTRASTTHQASQLKELQIQQKMNEIAKTIMRCLQEIERKHIDKLVLEFVHDLNMQLWLVNIPNCKFAVKAVKKKVGVNRSVVSYEDALEAKVPQISIHKAVDPFKTFTDGPVSDIPETNLPIITRIYQQLKGRPMSLRGKQVRSISTIGLSQRNSPSVDNFVTSFARTIQDSIEEPLEQSSMSYAFKDFLAKYTKRSLRDAVPDIAVSEVQLAPPNIASPINSDRPSTDLAVILANARTTLAPPSKRSLSYNKTVKSESQLHSHKNTRRSVSILTAESQTNRLDKVIEKLNVRHQELNRKYGSAARLPRKSQTKIKAGMLSPYATIGLKFMP